VLSRKEIIEKLVEILENATDNPVAIKDYDENSKITTDFGLSSVGMLYMVIAIEETFGIEFGDIDANTFKTLGDVVDYIEGKLKWGLSMTSLFLVIW